MQVNIPAPWNIWDINENSGARWMLERSHLRCQNYEIYSGWWFQSRGNDPFDQYFSNGLEPPTSNKYWLEWDILHVSVISEESTGMTNPRLYDNTHLMNSRLVLILMCIPEFSKGLKFEPLTTKNGPRGWHLTPKRMVYRYVLPEDKWSCLLGVFF